MMTRDALAAGQADLRPSSSASWVLQALAVFALAFLVRLLFTADLPARFDELYHLFAARSWADDGTLTVGHGVYDRGRYFTVLIGLLFEMTGSRSLLTARLLSVFCGSVLIALIFLWVRREAGRTAGWIAAGLLIFAAWTITIDNYLRFYALHALVFWSGAVLIFDATARRNLRRAVLPFLGGALLILVALYLQLTTVAGGLGLAIWIAGSLLARPDVRRALTRRTAILLAIGLAVAIAALLAATGLGETLAGMAERFRWAPLWNAEHQDDPTYYVFLFTKWMPVLFYLLPIAVGLAFRQAPRLTLFCVAMTAAILLVQSLGGMKRVEYVTYVLVWLLPIYAVALNAAFPMLVSLGESIRTMLPTNLGRWFAPAFALVSLSAVVLGNEMFRAPLIGVAKAAKASAVGGTPPDKALAEAIAWPSANWSPDRELLNRLAADSAIVVVTDELRALYYLGRYDILLSRSRLSEYAPDRDFARDRRTGGVAIASGRAVQAVIDCWPSGLLIANGAELREASTLGKDARQIIEQRTEVVAMPMHSAVQVVRWRHSAGNSSDSCDAVRRAVRPVSLGTNE